MHAALRQCPTYESPDQPLFTHSITGSRCEALQAHNYHKCGKCIFRSARPAGAFGSIREVRRQTACGGMR